MTLFSLHEHAIYLLLTNFRPQVKILGPQVKTFAHAWSNVNVNPRNQAYDGGTFHVPWDWSEEVMAELQTVL